MTDKELYKWYAIEEYPCPDRGPRVLLSDLKGYFVCGCGFRNLHGVVEFVTDRNDRMEPRCFMVLPEEA